MYATLISFRTWWGGGAGMLGEVENKIANLSELLGCGWPACTPYNEVHAVRPLNFIVEE